MDYEKAYNKALERAKKWYNAPNADKIPTYANRIIVEIFPELQESEDERIRKTLLESFEYQIKESRPDKEWLCGVKLKEIVSWLEKQGEKKATWSEEDEIGFNDTFWAIQQARTIAKDENDMGNLWYAEDWLKSLKERLS